MLAGSVLRYGGPLARRRVATMKDVAKLAGVDTSLVSRILSGASGYASLATRERVFEAVEQLDYRLNLAARSLRTSRSQLLAAVVPDISNPIYEPVAVGAARAASERGYVLLLGNAADSETFRDQYIARGVDGVLILSGTMVDETIRSLTRVETPVVVVNRRVSGIPACVTVDDTHAAVMAVDHLLALGHRRIGIIAGPEALATTRDRLKAIDARIKLARLPVAARAFAPITAQGGLEAAAALVREHADVTALLCTSFALAVGALKAAHVRGLRVPEELSVIAIHDAQMAQFTHPSLTTVALPMERLGVVAVEALLAIIEGGEPRRIEVHDPPELRVRESTAAPRGTDEIG